ncbi:MAG: hypothetical protein JRJ19_03330, partial [Deltaproteobacteria bacterium]|nr:hypothetical protein [Deltaproteobacteria bacterium]
KTAADLLDERVQVEKLPAAQLKGKRQPLEIFSVVPGQKLEVVFKRKT